jgi:hypothetical protein
MVEIIRWMCFVMVIGPTVVIGSIISATAGAPALYIDIPPNDTTMVYSDTITFHGRVWGTGGASIELVEVNNEPAKRDICDWNAKVSLYNGKNTIPVVATDETGNTTELNRTVYYITKPAAPQNLQLTAGDGYVNLGWSAPSDIGGSALTGYKIYRGTSSGGGELSCFC